MVDLLCSEMFRPSFDSLYLLSKEKEMREIKEICLFECDIDVKVELQKALKWAQENKNFLFEPNEEEEFLFVDGSCVSRECGRGGDNEAHILTRLQGIHIIESLIRDYQDDEVDVPEE